MSVSRIRDKRKIAKRPGFYVAVVRNTGVASVRDADHYYENGEEYERGSFFHSLEEAAEHCEVINQRISDDIAREKHELQRAFEDELRENGEDVYAADHEPTPVEVPDVSPSVDEDTEPTVVKPKSKAKTTKSNPKSVGEGYNKSEK